MTQLEQLIQDLCPNGVKMVKLGDVGTFENIGVDKKSNTNEQKVTLLNYVDIYKNKYIDASIPSMVVTAPDKKIEQCNVLQFDIFVTPTSETRDDIGHAAVVLEDLPNVVYSYHIMRFRLVEPNLNTAKFIRYLFETPIIQKQIYKAAKGLTRFGLSKYQFAELQIPLPPLAVQSEIVRILDKFTLYKAELAAELAARLQQYEYYRDQLLTFDDTVKRVKLGEVAELKAGSFVSRTELKDCSTNGFPCYGGNGIRGYVNHYSHEGSFSIIGRQGALCGCVHYATGKFYATEHAVVVKTKESVLSKYLYYVLVHANLNQYKSQGAQPGLAVSNLNQLVFSIPSLEVQERIVSILDRFDALCHDIREGLPAEIELRQKQYEHYRDKLLTFEAKGD